MMSAVDTMVTSQERVPASDETVYAKNDTVANSNSTANRLLASTSLLNNCQTLRIHPISDIFDPTKNYVGLISYVTGDIYLKQSNWILSNMPQRRRRPRGRIYIHGRLYYYIYGHWKMRGTAFIGGGFSYLDGVWTFVSRTLNTTDTDGQLNKFEEIVLQVVLDTLYINHRWLAMSPDHRVDCRSLARMERNQKYVSKADPANVHVQRRLHGTVKWLNDHRCRLGFIECVGLDRDFYLHCTAIGNSRSFPCSGENVEFDIVQTDHGWQAQSIIAIWP